MMEMGEPYRTLVFLVAVTGLRISEALGLKWSDLGYDVNWLGGQKSVCVRGRLRLRPCDGLVER